MTLTTTMTEPNSESPNFSEAVGLNQVSRRVGEPTLGSTVQSASVSADHSENGTTRRTPNRAAVRTANRASSPAPDSGTDRIKVRREWVGAAPGTITNPTFGLFVLASGGFSVSTLAYLFGALPALAATLINAVAIYIAFTVMHDAMHGVAHENRRVNLWLGRPMGMLLTISMPMFRAVHYEHHSHTNDPDRDPDLFMSHAPKWLAPLWGASVIFEYRRHYFGRRLWKNRVELIEAVAMEALLGAVFLLAVATGHLATVFVVWFGPALLATLFLAFAFDYLPHYPYDSRERYLDTRIYPGRIGFVVLLGQNYHLIHHLWTTVPWFRYARVFREIRPQLEARGARIGWRVDSQQDWGLAEALGRASH